MAIGLKLRDVRRFGQKVQKGVKTFGRKLANTADVVGAIATPLATAIAGPEGGIVVGKAVEGVKKLGRGAERLADKGAMKSERLFKQVQAPVLGAREIVEGAKVAMKRPEQGELMIGNTLAKRFPSRNTKSLQRDWAPDLPFAM